MAGGRPFASRVSAVLRAAGLPVLRYSASAASPTRGIKVSDLQKNEAQLSLRFDEEADLKRAADGIEAALRAKGLIFYSRSEAAHRDRSHLGLAPVYTQHFTVYSLNALPPGISDQPTSIDTQEA